MIVIGFDGKQRNWPVHSFTSKANASNLHLQVRALLKDLFPYDTICEELTLPGSNKGSNNVLYGDFFIPRRKLLVEAHGEQHYKYNPHFFNSHKEFELARLRDKIKQEWCELNGILYVELSYKETEDEWRAKIIRSITT